MNLKDLKSAEIGTSKLRHITSRYGTIELSLLAPDGEKDPLGAIDCYYLSQHLHEVRTLKHIELPGMS